jgi:hypothetical protein
MSLFEYRQKMQPHDAANSFDGIPLLAHRNLSDLRDATPSPRIPLTTIHDLLTNVNFPERCEDSVVESVAHSLTSASKR